MSTREDEIHKAREELAEADRAEGAAWDAFQAALATYHAAHARKTATTRRLGKLLRRETP